MSLKYSTQGWFIIVEVDFWMSRRRASGSFLLSIGPINYFAALIFFFIIHQILTITCVASAIDLSCLKPFWLSSSSCRCSAHHLKRVIQTRARIRLPMTNITTPQYVVSFYLSVSILEYLCQPSRLQLFLPFVSSVAKHILKHFYRFFFI